MRICRRSANSLALAALVCLAVAPAAAQSGHSDAGPGASPTLPQFTPVPEAIRERVRHAMQRQRDDVVMLSRADVAAAAGRTAMGRERDAMAEKLHAALGLAAPDLSAIARIAAPDAHIGFVPLLFVSSSMPIDELRTYASQLDHSGGALAFRGTPGGLRLVAPMAKLAAEILRIDPDCEGPDCAMRAVPIVIDPIAFRRLHVTQVPTLAMVLGDPTMPYCERGDGPAGPDIIVSGDAALTGLLEEYARLGGREEVRDAEARLARR